MYMCDHVYKSHRSIWGHMCLHVVPTLLSHQALQANSHSTGAGSAGRCLWVLQGARQELHGVDSTLLHLLKPKSLSSEALPTPGPRFPPATIPLRLIFPFPTAWL